MNQIPRYVKKIPMKVVKRYIMSFVHTERNGKQITHLSKQKTNKQMLINNLK